VLADIEVRFKLGDYFKQGSHKVAISLPDLVSQTNSFSTKNRPGCAPSLNGSKPKELFLAYNVKCSLITSDPAGHDVKVRFDVSEVHDETTAKNLDVAVSCSCPAFLYWGAQWNAHQRDALEGEPRPLLTAPTERLDLRENFVICKHVKAVSERILPSVQHNIVKILRQRDIEQHKDQVKPPKPSLTQRQDEMRKRQEEKKKKAPPKQRNNDKVRQQLEQGLQNRENDVVKRDTPATPEEQERVPTIPPQDVEAPDAHQKHLEEDIPDFENAEKDVTPPAPLTPQKMPTMNQQDRETMKRMQREEQKRQQQQQEQRLRNMKVR
jgi:hypothetical protein